MNIINPNALLQDTFAYSPFKIYSFTLFPTPSFYIILFYFLGREEGGGRSTHSVSKKVKDMHVFHK